MESPNTMFSTHCALHRKRKNTRRKWKHLEYGKNWLFIPNRLIWIIANKNVFSTTYSYHRNAVAGTSTERIGVRETVGSLSFGGWCLKGKGLVLVLEWSWLGQSWVTPVSALGNAMVGASFPVANDATRAPGHVPHQYWPLAWRTRTEARVNRHRRAGKTLAQHVGAHIDTHPIPGQLVALELGQWEWFKALLSHGGQFRAGAMRHASCEWELRLSLLFACSITKSCLTLWDLMNFSPPGSSVYGDSPGKNIGMGCHFHRIFLTQGSETSPVSAALAGRFFTTEPPEKPLFQDLELPIPSNGSHSFPILISLCRDCSLIHEANNPRITVGWDESGFSCPMAQTVPNPGICHWNALLFNIDVCILPYALSWIRNKSVCFP